MTIKDFYIQVEYILIHRIYSAKENLRNYFKLLARKIDNTKDRDNVVKRIDYGAFDSMYY